MNWRDKIREKAKKALEKPAKINIKIEEYIKNEYTKEINKEIVKRTLKVMKLDESNFSGEYVQIDFNVIEKTIKDKLKKYGVIVLSLDEALNELDWIKEYFWNAVPVDKDKFTAYVELYGKRGYFIYVPPDTKIEEPILACLLIHSDKVAQLIHNIVIVDENSELNLITACSSFPRNSLHIGVSEFYVKKNAKLTFTMVHFWKEHSYVLPRTGVIVEDGGIYNSTYILLNPAKYLESFPEILLKENASANVNTIILSSRDSKSDIGTKIVFLGENSRGEIRSRAILKDESKVIMKGILESHSRSKGYLDCKALILSEKASVEAIPILKSYNKNAELSHEAAIGRISKEKIEYLMSKGFDENEAISILVRGFIESGLENIPKKLKEYVESILDLISKYATS